MPIPNWQKSDHLSIEAHQRLVDAVNQIITTDGEVELTTLPNGQTIRGAKAQVMWRDIGTIVAAGPNGEADLKFDQYWVATGIAFPRSAQSINQTVVKSIKIIHDSNPATIVAATNIGEMNTFRTNDYTGDTEPPSTGCSSDRPSCLHSLRIGTRVELFAIEIRFPTGTKEFVTVFNTPPTTFKAKIGTSTELADGRFKYEWKEQRLKRDGEWEDNPGGMTQATTTPAAYAYNTLDTATSSIEIPSGTIVDLLGYDNCHGDREYEFSPGGGGDKGTLQYQVHIMLTDNESGWSYPKFH